MNIRSIWNLLVSGDLHARMAMVGVMKHEGRLMLYHAGLATGLFKVLDAPSTLDEIARATGIPNTRLLSSLLDLGCSLGEISRKKEKYGLKGAMAKALVHNRPLAELVRETVQYHGDVASRLGDYLRKGTGGDYLEKFGGVIAESSRLTEPLIKAFIYGELKKSEPHSILEIGCGSGEYLKYYVDIDGGNSGMAIDIDAGAVKIARGKLAEHRIEKNFIVEKDDIRKTSMTGNKTFDIITSYSNMHYFTDGEKKDFFRKVHGMLNPGGRFLLATGFKCGSLTSRYYDLVFSATRGLHGLPLLRDVVRELGSAGFSRVKTVRLMGETFAGIVAYRLGFR